MRITYSGWSAGATGLHQSIWQQQRWVGLIPVGEGDRGQESLVGMGKATNGISYWLYYFIHFPVNGLSSCKTSWVENAGCFSAPCKYKGRSHSIKERWNVAFYESIGNHLEENWLSDFLFLTRRSVGISKIRLQQNGLKVPVEYLCNLPVKMHQDQFCYCW